MKPTIFFCIGLIFTNLGYSAPQNLVDVHVKWKMQEIDQEIELYELAPGKPLAVWTTGTTVKKSELPVGRKIPKSKFTMPAGGKKTFVLVMHNDSKKEQYFFAAPHMVHPAKHSLGFEFQCLCLNHAFKVPAGEYWYRVVELTLDKNFTGESVKVVHAILGTDAKRHSQMQREGATIAPQAHGHHHH